MQSRESTPRRFHHAILRLSSSSTVHRIPARCFLVNLGYCRTLRFSSQSFYCLMATPGNDGDILANFQKRFLKHHRVPCMVWQSSIAAKQTSGAQNSRGLTGRAARCLRIVKLLFPIQGIQHVLQVLSLRKELIHCRGFIFLLRRKFSPHLPSSFKFSAIPLF